MDYSSLHINDAMFSYAENTVLLCIDSSKWNQILLNAQNVFYSVSVPVMVDARSFTYELREVCCL